MRTLPTQMIRLLAPFVPLFSKRVWQHAQVLLAGAILAPGARTVTGRKDRKFRPARDGLGPREAVPPLPPGLEPRQLVESEGESRAVGVAGGGVRARRISSGGGHRRYAGAALGQEDLGQGRLPRPGAFHPPKLRQEQRPLTWVCVMVLVEIPWASRVWALPFLSALAPSERYAARRGRRHKKLTEWAWQM